MIQRIYSTFRNYLQVFDNEAYMAHRTTLLRIYWGIVGVMALSAIFNLTGYKVLNAYLSLGLGFVFLYYGTKARLLAALVTFGVITGDEAKSNGETVKGVLEQWARLAGKAYLCVSIYMLVAATISFKYNPGVVGLLLAAVATVLLGDALGWVKTHWAKKICISYAIFVICLSFLSLPPRAMWENVVGFYPMAKFNPTKSEIALMEYEDRKRELKDEAVAAKIKKMTEDLERPKVSEEQGVTEDKNPKLIETLQEEREETDLPSTLGKAWGELWKEDPEPVEVTKVWKTVYRGEYTGKGMAFDDYVHTIDDSMLEVNDRVYFVGENVEVWYKGAKIRSEMIEMLFVNDGHLANWAPKDKKFLVVVQRLAEV